MKGGCGLGGAHRGEVCDIRLSAATTADEIFVIGGHSLDTRRTPLIDLRGAREVMMKKKDRPVEFALLL